MSNKKKLSQRECDIIQSLYFWILPRSTFKGQQIEEKLSQMFGVSKTTIRRCLYKKTQ